MYVICMYMWEKLNREKGKGKSLSHLIVGNFLIELLKKMYKCSWKICENIDLEERELESAVSNVE